MKIILLTPYTGGNLGDAAIQEAVIANVRRRDASAELVLVTLAPHVTTALHGVPTFPISAASSRPGFPPPHNEESMAPEPPQVPRLRAPIKRSTLLGGMWKKVRPALRRIALLLGWRELRHVVGASRAMRGAKLVIVSGGGQLDDYWGGPFRQPYALLKWGVLAKLVRARYVFVSVGRGSLSTLSSFLTRFALRLADYRSYRDQRTKALLGRIPWTRGDPVFPDLAFSYTGGAEQRAEVKPRGRVVGVSPIAYLSQYGWPDQDSVVYDNYAKNLRELVAGLIARSYEVVFFSSNVADRPVINELLDRLRENPAVHVHEQVSCPSTVMLPELMAQLEGVDFVIASRLHGILLAHLLAKPTLAISYDPKVDTHMEEVGMSDFCLDIHALRPESIGRAFESLVAGADRVAASLRATNRSYAQMLQAQYDHVLALARR